MMYSTYPFIAIFLALYLSSVIVRPSPWRWLFFPVMVVTYIHIIINTSTGDRVSDYFIGLPLSIALCNASTFILLSDPQHSAFRKGQTVPAYHLPFSERVLWAADLIVNLRGINWSFEIPGVRRSDASRWQFVASQLVRALAHYLMYDAATFFNRRNSAFHAEGETMGERGYIYQAVNVLMFWFTFTNSMALKHAFVSAITVASGAYSPRDWPIFFGSWLHTTTVRSFWGRTWHQMLRRSISTHGKYLAQSIFHFAPGTTVSSYTQLYLGFFLSGYFHSAGEWMMSHSFDRFAYTMYFYLAQAVAITVEDIVIGLSKRSGLSFRPIFSWITGVIWVLIWTVWSGPLWMEPMIRSGVMEDGPNISVFEYFAS